ncbi:LptF/LptG family permease [Campylobacter sp. LR264d]|uniref:LptF/LptG family permease n=1 Tax=Campylobacter sp. LR264d TaxID=2593544 RepID=UPI0012389A12|nr:LptF/LptG family permease [Campylobacter sp. LR264d]KAA6231134.1 LptF/LptG family permease [Campylobacter sp. LR264d]
MWIFFRFISSIYLKNFFILFFALLGFYCGIDLLLNFKDLPNSANLGLLYTLFLAFSAITYVLPISLIFALVLSLLNMIRNNEFVSLYALGLSKNLVIIFPFIWAIIFCFIYIISNFTPFAYANDYKRNILKNGTLSKQSTDLFLKFDDSFIYISSLNEQNTLNEVKIFNIKDLNLSSFIVAKKAVFKDETWTLKETNATSLPDTFLLGENGFVKENFESISGLAGFKPKIIENVANNRDSSIKDSLESLILFKEQGININAIKISLYKQIFTPFFAPFLMLIMYYFFPIISRFFNLAFVAFVAFIVTFAVWGTLFIAMRLSENGVIASELAIVLPILCLGFFAFFIFYKHR